MDHRVPGWNVMSSCLLPFVVSKMTVSFPNLARTQEYTVGPLNILLPIRITRLP